jgi:hypothetical protein
MHSQSHDHHSSSSSPSFSSSSSSTSSYPSHLQDSALARELYDVIPNQPADVINIMCGYTHTFNPKGKSCYEGAVNEEGKRHGVGTEIWPDGRWRQGLYANDEFMGGRGKMMDRDEVKEGIWIEGKLHATFEGKWNMHDSLFQGKFILWMAAHMRARCFKKSVARDVAVTVTASELSRCGWVLL